MGNCSNVSILTGIPPRLSPFRNETPPPRRRLPRLNKRRQREAPPSSPRPRPPAIHQIPPSPSLGGFVPTCTARAVHVGTAKMRISVSRRPHPRRRPPPSGWFHPWLRAFDGSPPRGGGGSSTGRRPPP